MKHNCEQTLACMFKTSAGCLRHGQKYMEIPRNTYKYNTSINDSICGEHAFEAFRERRFIVVSIHSLHERCLGDGPVLSRY